ncbi:MAG: ribosome-associated translation inhibitor RaiA [Calditrichaeota bacterium]|nr:ribosome-associated translation inhibitor RaiA [Calditrichota bacterium]MCB9367793.1 ribosome-associated translation inhibitor RaiA [Calditrichota bacterium]
MRTQITAVHFNATDTLKEFAENEVQRLLKFSDDIVNCEIEFTFNKQEKRANIHISVDNTVLNASAITEDFKKSVVLAVDKLEVQVKKHKGKIHAKH